MALDQQPALQLIYNTAPIGLAFLSPDCRYLQINQRLTEICGISIEGHLGRTVRDCVPALADSVEAIVSSIMATGQPVVGIEVKGQRTDQLEERSWLTYWHPLHGPNGNILGINVAAEEVTERKRVEAALQASEKQFHTLADSIPQLVWMAEADGKIFWFNGHWYDYTGKRPGDVESHDWQALLAPSSLHEGKYRWAQSLRAGSALEMEILLRGKDGEYRPFLTRVVPLRDASGKIYRWIGTHIDISEQRRREEHIRFVIEELSHRTKNLLSVVMAVANQTAQTACDVKQYQARFSDRLRALAHCHDLLVRDSWHGASFEDLLTGQLKPFREGNADRVTISGPPVVLSPDAVQNLGLAIHELATNASKYGALSVPDGKVLVTWKQGEGDEKLSLRWEESGGPPVVPSSRKGFGHIVISEIVPRALGGKGVINCAPTGLCWTFEFSNRAYEGKVIPA
ncbi:MAG: PAS domain-containing protein [Xanthobacteraceae bacterium]|nr:PAS domain-containing protein [Xanthobacteraceae bacterium]